MQQTLLLRSFILILCLFSLLRAPYSLANTQLDYEKALSAYKEQRFDESMIYLKNALFTSPDNLPSKILMGQLLTKLGQYGTAEVEFSEVIRQGADISLFANSWGLALLKLKKYEKIIGFKQLDNFTQEQQLAWQRIRAIACLEAKNYECAKESYGAIGHLGKNKAEQFNGLANIEFNLKNFPLALDYLQKAGEIEPNNPITWQLKGLVARNQNKLELALEYLHRAFELEPNDPYILRNLADVYLASNNNQAAKETINIILSSSPNDPFAILVNRWLQQDTVLEAEAEKKFNELAVKISNYPTELIEQEQSLLFLRALVAFRQQNFAQAERDFIKLRKLDDSDISPILLLAKSYIALNKEKDAIALLESNRFMLEGLPDILVMLGDLYINNNKNFKAVSLLESLQINYADNLQVRLLDAKLLIARGRIEEGLNSLDTLLSDYPNNETILFVHSVLSLQAQEFTKADASISTLLTLKPDATKLNLKGAILIKLNRLVEAERYLNDALALQPDLLSARFNLAAVYSLQGNLAKARQLLDIILQQQPRHASALILLANIQLSQQQLEEAYSNYRLVLSDNNQSIEALEGLVSVHLAKNELNDALFQLNKLNKLQTKNPKYLIQKAQIYLSLQDTVQGKREIEALARLSQQDPALMIALSKLQLLAGDLNAAIASLEHAQNLQPKSLAIGLQLAELLLNNQLTQAASNQITLVASRFAANDTITFLQGRLAEQKGQPKQANQFYLKTLELNEQFELALAKMYALTTQGYPPLEFKNRIDDIVNKYPQRYFPRNLLAQFYYYNKDFKLAAYHYERLLQHPELPNKPAMLDRLALVYMSIDMLKSTQYAQQAYELDKTNPSILTTYGWLLTQQDRPEEGLSMLRKALARSQQNPAIHYYIAVSLNRLGLIPEAISELEALFAKKIEINELEEAQALYKKLTEV